MTEEQSIPDIEYRTLTFIDAFKLKCPLPNGESWHDLWYQDYDCGIWLFINDVPIMFVGADGHEPENNTLNKDFAWVATALNHALMIGLLAGTVGESSYIEMIQS